MQTEKFTIYIFASSFKVFGSNQVATFYYINAAPQWQTFNNGNWVQVEVDLKKFIAKRNIDTEVYTGTHDILSYPDINGKYQKIYLATSNMTKPMLPVPKLYYKVVVAKSINAGIVLIGVNDPHASMERIKSEYIICRDISDKIQYIKWERDNILAGYSYACSIKDFSAVVKDLPDFPEVTELLL